MAFIFLSYLISFFLIWKQKKNWALLMFTLSTLLSIAMFFYHTTSTLNLNF